MPRTAEMTSEGHSKVVRDSAKRNAIYNFLSVIYFPKPPIFHTPFHLTYTII